MVCAKRLLFGLVATTFLLGSSSVLAQEEGETEIVKEDDVQKDEDDDLREDGFDGRLSTSATFNLVSNSNVVGQNNGNSVMLGGNILGGLDFVEGKHKVSNTLTYNTSWARTPVIAEFVKNNDEIQLENIYNYFLTDWIGPYARLSFQTSLFPAERVTADPQLYEITRLDGGQDTETTDRLRLADPVNPFELFQSAGIFLEPVRKQAIQAMLRVGLGARETLAQGVLIVQDDPNSTAIEVQELDDVIQAGAEAFLGAQGKFPEQRIDYRLGATAMIPVINNYDPGPDQEEKSAVDLTRLGFNGALTFNALEWLGVSYDVNLLSDPQMLDKVQIQNSVLLTFNYTFLEADDIKKPEPSDDAPAPTKELAKTKKELEAAEERAEKAEKRAAELEKQLGKTEQDLDTRKQDLDKSQQELDKSQQELDQSQEELDQSQQELEEAEQEAQEQPTEEETTEEDTEPTEDDTTTDDEEPATDEEDTGTQ